MNAHETVLFENCPLCGQAEIFVERPRRLSIHKVRIKPCPICYAEFVAKGSDKFQLVFCEPHKITGRHKCRERVSRGCYLGSTFSRAEWERIANGSESSDFAKFLHMSTSLRQGLLSTCTSEELPFPLQPGEILHHVSCPVYVDEQRPSKQKDLDKGKFLLTSNRIVYESPSKAFTIQLENVERVEESAPGFFVKEKDAYEPRYFFPPTYDPVCAAVLGAVHNLKKKRS